MDKVKLAEYHLNLGRRALEKGIFFGPFEYRNRLCLNFRRGSLFHPERLVTKLYFNYPGEGMFKMTLDDEQVRDVSYPTTRHALQLALDARVVLTGVCGLTIENLSSSTRLKEEVPRQILEEVLPKLFSL